MFGQDACPALETKAAAPLHSVVGNHALVDGNERLGLASLIAFIGLNGHRLTWSIDEAYEFVMKVAPAELDDVAVIAEGIAAASEPWPEF